MTKARTLIILLWGLLLLSVTMVVVAFVAPESNATFQSANVALAFITGAAIGIERTIEAGWTVMGGVLGNYWPLNWVRKHADSLVDSLAAMVGPLQAQVEEVLRQVEGKTDLAAKHLPRLQTDLRALTGRVAELKTMAPDSQRFQMVVAAAAQQVNGLEKAYGEASPELKRTLETTKSSIEGMQGFLSSFKDNPGRRLISIFVGAFLGLVLAGAFGLDVFQAVMEGGPERDVGRIIITGLMIGLGSSPTHEVIRAIQEYKKSRGSDSGTK